LARGWESEDRELEIGGWRIEDGATTGCICQRVCGILGIRVRERAGGIDIQSIRNTLSPRVSPLYKILLKLNSYEEINGK